MDNQLNVADSEDEDSFGEVEKSKTTNLADLLYEIKNDRKKKAKMMGGDHDDDDD